MWLHRETNLKSNQQSVTLIAVHTPYDGGEVGSNLGLDESFVEGSVWSGNHQGGEQVEGEVLKSVGDAAQTPEQMRQQLVMEEKKGKGC